ncbi:MAG TPA: pseudouridine synthase [Thiopseudomonas sp.]|nr:pseudouridine synthase [Thiopseudomonas sp.]
MTQPTLLGASRVHLPSGPYALLLDFLCERFAAISRESWQQRMLDGKVLDGQRRCLTPTEPYQAGTLVYYFREVPNETAVPFTESILYQDEHLIAVDKPHFLPTMPAGRYVEETLLRRLMKRLDNADIVPIHRLDRLTAGVVLFSVNPCSRDAYQGLFRQRKVFKCYEALAGALPELAWPYRHRSRLEPAEQFFRMQEVAGVANSDTVIEVCEQLGDVWRYRLYPVTGRKHQLRVHLAALGAAIINDPLYPQLQVQTANESYQQPLQLLARQMSFVDPLTGVLRSFKSQLTLSL